MGLELAGLLSSLPLSTSKASVQALWNKGEASGASVMGGF